MGLEGLAMGLRGAAKGGSQLLLNTPKVIHRHHVLPQQFRNWFANRGISNIDDFTVPLSRSGHLKGVHGKGLGNMPGGWNRAWADFIKANPNATPSQIFHQAEGMLQRYGLEHLRYVHINKIIMSNISIKGERLILDKGSYIIIDGLYLNDVRDYIKSKEQRSDLTIDELRSEAFPHTNAPFVIIHIDENIEFDLGRFKKVEYSRISNCTDKYLSTDTGLLLFIKKEKLLEFVVRYEFDRLVDLDPIDGDYWSSIIEDFNDNEIGLIVSPGIHSEYEFDGGGLYQII